MKLSNLTISSREKLTFIINLGTMISAGIPILYAINSLLEGKKGNVKKILTVVHEHLLQGNPLHVSFSKFPKIFDKVTVNIIRASEEAGTLDIALKDLKEQIKKDIEF